MIYNFPKNFWWGSAFSAIQTEGGEDQGKKSPNVWWDIYKHNKHFFYDDNYCLNDFYHKYSEDIDIAKNLNFNSLRTSIQWARLIPDGINVDQDAVNFYNNVINKMIANNITPIINLFHNDMPLWAQNIGGWLSEEVLKKYVNYANTCFKLFSDRVKYWVTFNEPIVIAECGYIHQYYPPFETNMKHFIHCQWNLLTAHFNIVKNYKENYDGKIGIILNITPGMSRTNEPADLEATEIANAIQTKSFLDSIVKHKYPQIILDLAKKYKFMPVISDKSKKLIANKKINIDFLGLNYYSPLRIKALDFVPNFKDGVITPHYFFEPYLNKPGIRINKSRGWEIYPKGIYDCMKDIQNNYGNISFYISENGMGVNGEENFMDKDGIVNDQYRIDFLSEHLVWVSKAISEGANCFGYHMWTYIDNWSFMNAYKNRYGFVRLDLKTQKRINKKSAQWIKNVIKNSAVEFNDPID